MRRTAWTVVGLVFATTLLRSVADGIGLSDESWFLQVVARMRAGDVLYRDMFFGVTPLSAYLTWLVTWVTGVDVLSVKLVTNLAFAVTTGLAWYTSRAIAGDRAAGLVAGLLLVFGRPYLNPPYTPVAVAGFMLALSAAVPAPGGSDRRGLRVAVGVALAFLSKQNVGLLALAAVATAILMEVSISPRLRVRLVTGIAGMAIAACGCGLLPTWWSGGWPRLLDYGFTNKGTYLRVAGVRYAASVAEWLGTAAPPWTPAAPIEFVRGAILIMPAIVLMAAAVRWRRSSLDLTDWRALAFTAAGILIALPRWNRFHMAYALPAELVALVSLCRQPMARWTTRSRAVRLALASALPVAVVVTALPGLMAISRGHPSRLPHFHGAIMEPAVDDTLRREVNRLSSAAGNRPTFILDSRAGFLYLAAGLRNPTPFDLPWVTSVGRHGTAILLRELGDGTLSQVCVGREDGGLYPFSPVVPFVTAHFEPGDDTGLCRMYRSPEVPHT